MLFIAFECLFRLLSLLFNCLFVSFSPFLLLFLFPLHSVQFFTASKIRNGRRFVIECVGKEHKLHLPLSLQLALHSMDIMENPN